MYVERASSIESAVVWSVGGEPAGGRVLPDGCMDLLWLDDELVIAGPDTRAYVSRSSARRSVVGIRLAAGVLPRALSVPADELRDRRARLAEVWGVREARRLRAQMAAAPDVAAELERIVGARLEESAPDPVMAYVDALARRGMPVPAVARAISLSERQLRRRTHAAFGYGVKMLARIHRFQTAIALARDGVPVADAAVRSGYADQPHLAREVRTLAGAPLSALLT
ncbi:helix-turn-helix domain-containing protein [Solicola gregarius]|uniref:Helix-turn-helix domain-containing protein n=1 Tax=Solicola gregarius TaxID=2908642 RepID=A0AA46TH46_9ACTN|nr:helix-turn-helix domain-containing protein [Solicola gregarius]UYM05221.1 helix-turn-helix domain-containing protein [Solicola gregarius]